MDMRGQDMQQQEEASIKAQKIRRWKGAALLAVGVMMFCSACADTPSDGADKETFAEQASDDMAARNEASAGGQDGAAQKEVPAGEQDSAAQKEATEAGGDQETGQPGTDSGELQEEGKDMGTEKIAITKGFKGMEDTNPLMTQRFGADPYAMVYKDRVYIYMTADAFEYEADGSIKENTYSKIHQINVISTNDMVNFTDHGAVNAASQTGIAKWARNSWAPAAAWKEIGGKDQFFLYFADAGGGIGVLQADSPTGPFYDPLGKGLVTRETPNCADVLWLFDPAVLMDDDGRAYLYFGGGVPEGKVAAPGTARVAQLGADMISIVGEPKTIDVPYLFEDSGIHKAGEKYYYTYCTNWQVDAEGTKQYGFHNGEIACMVSDAPMGPFVYQETILRNPGSVFGLSGNNHHCVFRFQDQWYIAYHTRVLEKAMGVEKGYRCTHIDAFEMQEDGTIGEIKQTLRGREQLRFVDAYQQNVATCFAVMAGVDTVENKGDGADMVLTGIDRGDFVKVAGVDFGGESPKLFAATLRCAEEKTADGAVQVRVDSPEGELLASLPVKELTDREKFVRCETQLLASVQGVHDLYLVFDGEGYEIDCWQFEK